LFFLEPLFFPLLIISFSFQLLQILTVLFDRWNDNLNEKIHDVHAHAENVNEIEGSPHGLVLFCALLEK
jgi:hypothetical protein